MINFIISFFLIITIDFLIFYFFNKFLVLCILTNKKNNWVYSFALVSFIIPVLCSFFNISFNFAFFLDVSVISLIMGFSSNYKDDENLFNEIELMQKKALKYSVISALIGYISFVKVI